MPLYHFSCNIYEKGQILPVREEPSSFHNRSMVGGRDWINEILEEAAPEDAPIRSRAYYAFGSLEHCLSYSNSINCPNGEKYFYEVELINKIEAPMILTKLLNIVGQNHTNVESIVQEYWNRTKDWKFIEYLGDSMKVVKPVEFDSSFDRIIKSNKGKLDYESDDRLMNEYMNEF